MADCYYHGYSGGPGACSQCEMEVERRLEPGTLNRDRPRWPEPTRFTPSGKPHWRNDDLPAGSPMYYYCERCGEEADVKAEGWDPRHEPKPRRVCLNCEAKAATP